MPTTTSYSVHLHPLVKLKGYTFGVRFAHSKCEIYVAPEVFSLSESDRDRLANYLCIKTLTDDETIESFLMTQKI